MDSEEKDTFQSSGKEKQWKIPGRQFHAKRKQCRCPVDPFTGWGGVGDSF